MKALLVFLLLTLPAVGQRPNPRLTPGSVRTTDAKEICGKKFRTKAFRHTTLAMKRKVLQDYGIRCSPYTAQNAPYARFGNSSYSSDFARTHLGSQESNVLNDGSLYETRMSAPKLRRSSFVFSSPSSPTGNADARTILGESGICFTKRMTQPTMGLTRLIREWTSSTQDILAVSNWFKMIWIEAQWLPTKMVEFTPIWDSTSHRDPDNDMCTALAPSPIPTALHGSSGPEPTAIAVSDSSVSHNPINIATHARHSLHHVQSCSQILEIDHLIPIELGGADTVINLWPEFSQYADGSPGFHVKDLLENRLHREVCAGRITLVDAQRCIARDWIRCYQKVVAREKR